MSKEAMKLALEALEKLNNTKSYWWQEVDKDVAVQLLNAETALREALAEQPAQQEPVAWVPYLSDRADGVSGHYAIARWNPRGYREVWNLRRHAWAAYSDDVLSLEEADTLLRLIEIPTRKVETPQPAQQPDYWLSYGLQAHTEKPFEGATPVWKSPPARRKALADEDVKSICNIGPVYAPDGVVTRTPQQYRQELEAARLHGLRRAEAAHNIKEKNT